jgi:tripartite-type tricarboxylate transporter receptor subunit TctC
MHRISRRAFIAGCAAAVVPHSVGAQAQALRIVYPYAAGGSLDAVARLLAERLQKTLSRPVIVENRTGAGGRVGAKAVIQAEPDGSMLLFATTPLIALHPHIYPNLGYDPIKDLLPISQVVQTDLAFAVGPGMAPRSVQELTEWIRTNPELAHYGSPGAGTISHFAAAEMARQLRLDIRHVPYRGTGAAMPDILGGRVPMYIAATPELIEQHRARRVRILATTGAARSFLLPDVPTFREEGVNILAPLWCAVYAPARTPPGIADALSSAIVSVLQIADVRERILAIGFQPTGTTGQELRRIQQADLSFWAPIIEASGYKPAD